MTVDYAADQPGALAPDTSGAEPVPLSQGRTFFVDPATGADVSGRGTNPFTPAATIAWVQTNLVVAGRGDTIRCRPGTYLENLVLTKDYLKVQGMLPGKGRPNVAPAAGIALVIRGVGIRIESMRFVNGAVDSDVVRIEGNGWGLKDVQIDGTATMGAGKALLRVWASATADATLRGADGLAEDCLLRGNGNLGRGLVFDIQNVLNAVGPANCLFNRIRFNTNTLEDVYAAETAAAVISVSYTKFEECSFEDRNKATMIDLDTNNGAGNVGNLFVGCFFWDDTFDATTFKGATADAGLIGCFSLDGLIDGDALD